MDWKQYEKEIVDHFRAEYADATIIHNAKVQGRFSKVERQIDLLIEGEMADFRFRVVVDSKYRDKKIDVNDVESFIGMVRDVEADRGVMISSEGYSSAAINRAYYDDSDIELDVLNFKDLERFHAFGAIPRAGGHSVLLPAPFGWVIDATRREGMVATLYQRGLTFESAVEAGEWMYVNFWSKDQTANSIESLCKFQESYLSKPDYKIEYQDGPSRQRVRTRIRLLRRPAYSTEYTGFVEFTDFIFFCVLLTPHELEPKNLRKLRYIMRTVLPIGIRFAPPKECVHPIAGTTGSG
jgi:hypothetical protein